MPVKKVVDASLEEGFFLERSKLRRPRGTRTGDAVTTLTERKRKSGRGNAFQHTKTGARSDLGGLVVRSNWEANTIRVLNLYRIPFEFEPTQFAFPPHPTSGVVRSYIPDIYLANTDEYIEVKGYLDGKGRNKIRKFRKHYPQEFSRLTVIISRSNKANLIFFTKMGVQKILFYENIAQLYADKVDWEGKV